MVERWNNSIVSDISDSKFQCDLDSHADTCIAGKAFKVVETTNKMCKVYPYLDEYKPKIVNVVNAITAYDSPEGETFILLVNEALSMPNLEPSLLCPNQLRSNGIIVNNYPRQFDSLSTHSIHIDEYNLTIPLYMDGIMSMIPVRYPKKHEEEQCTWIPLTSPQDWNPNSDEFEKAEVML